MAPGTARGWDVLLVGGPSGAGKSSLSYPLAARYGLPVLEVDDIVCALQAVTTPESLPAVNFWETEDASRATTPREIFEQGLDVLRELRPALEAVIANHLETEMPVVIDGDFIAPSLAVAACFGSEPNGGRVRGVFVVDDEAQICANYLAREPDRGVQAERAAVSGLWSDWLATDAAEHGVPVVRARPWQSLVERVERILDVPTAG